MTPTQLNRGNKEKKLQDPHINLHTHGYLIIDLKKSQEYTLEKRTVSSTT